MPLYRCADCGFVTTASRENAVAAHEEGSLDCAGALELIADFARPSMVASAGARRRRAGQGSDRVGQGAAPVGQGSAPAHGASPTRPDGPAGVAA